jgi:hypothetical protein
MNGTRRKSGVGMDIIGLTHLEGRSGEIAVFSRAR